MSDDGLDIPEFLRRAPETPEEVTKRKIRMKRDATISMRRRMVAANKGPTDREGRPLPKGMDEGSWALLRAMEHEAARREKAAAKESKRIKKAQAAEMRAMRAAAKAAKEALTTAPDRPPGQS